MYPEEMRASYLAKGYCPDIDQNIEQDRRDRHYEEEILRSDPTRAIEQDITSFDEAEQDRLDLDRERIDNSF